MSTVERLHGTVASLGGVDIDEEGPRRVVPARGRLCMRIVHGWPMSADTREGCMCTMHEADNRATEISAKVPAGPDPEKLSRYRGPAAWDRRADR